MSVSKKITYFIGLLIFITALPNCGKSPASVRSAAGGKQMIINLWHADSLAGPMSELKKAFEAKNPNIAVHLTSGRSKELAERIFKGETCDIFAPSDPQVVKDMIGKSINGKEAASWYIAFSANELVVITKKGNPFGIKRMIDLSKDGVIFARVSGENDMEQNGQLSLSKMRQLMRGIVRNRSK